MKAFSAVQNHDHGAFSVECQDPKVRPALHMFVGSRAPWWEPNAAIPEFDEWVPGYAPEDPEPVAGSPQQPKD